MRSFCQCLFRNTDILYKHIFCACCGQWPTIDSPVFPVFLLLFLFQHILFVSRDDSFCTLYMIVPYVGVFVCSQGEKNAGFDVLYHNMKHGQIATKELAEFVRERWDVVLGGVVMVMRGGVIWSNWYWQECDVEFVSYSSLLVFLSQQ